VSCGGWSYDDAGRAVAAALIAFVVWDRTGQSLHGFVVDWHATAPSRVIRDLALPVLVVGVGVVLFLIESANVLARFVLRSARVESDTEPTDSSDRKKWLTTRLFDGKRPDVEDLRGGRLIGPLERLLILALSLGGFFPIVVGIIAAKGMVRFPEISNDVPGGSEGGVFSGWQPYELVTRILGRWRFVDGGELLIS
jgi:hypothetical protein